MQYDDLDIFFEGLARVSLNKKWGFIDKSGGQVIAMKYDAVGNFTGGFAWIGINNKYDRPFKLHSRIVSVFCAVGWSSIKKISQIPSENIAVLGLKDVAFYYCVKVVATRYMYKRQLPVRWALCANIFFEPIIGWPFK